jgi:hypothetical protein
MAGTRSRWERVARDERVRLVGLACRGSEALDPLGVCGLDLAALPLERVVDEPGAGHRLDHGANRLAVDLVDPASERSEPLDIGPDCELIEMIPLPESRQTSSFRRLRSSPACNL